MSFKQLALWVWSAVCAAFVALFIFEMILGPSSRAPVVVGSIWITTVVGGFWLLGVAVVHGVATAFRR